MTNSVLVLDKNKAKSKNEIKPSTKLSHLIDNCVSGFKKLEDAVKDALEQGRKEGYTDKQIGGMIREKMLAVGYERHTVARALPPSAKGKPRGNPHGSGSVRNSLLLSSYQQQQQEQEQEQGQEQELFQALDLKKKGEYNKKTGIRYIPEYGRYNKALEDLTEYCKEIVSKEIHNLDLQRYSKELLIRIIKYQAERYENLEGLTRGRLLGEEER